MKIIENMTNGYRKIASGIAIVAFLTLMYFALIPGGTMALSFVTAVSGDPIIGAFVKLVDYPQYNATTVGPDGNYVMNDVPYGDYLISAQAPLYSKNVSIVNVSSSAVVKDFTLTPGSITGDYRNYAFADAELASNKVSTLSDIGTSFTIPQYGDNVGWNTEVYITDASGLGATLTLQYYTTGGILAVTENPTVPANGTYKWIPSDGTGGRPTTGKLVITSTNNVVGWFKIYSIANTDKISSKLYSSVDTGTSFTIPQYGDNVAFGTWVAISDVSGLGATLTIKYYTTAGALVKTETPSVPANGMYTFIPSDGTGGRPTTGKLEITSTSAVTGEYRIFSFGTGGILSNKLYTSADKKTEFSIPQYGDNVAFGTWIAISDVSGLGANLTIKYYTPSGTMAKTETSTISANGMYTFIPSDGTAGRPTIGKLSIYSTNSVSGEMRIFSLSGRGIMANSLFTQQDISGTVIVPYYGNNVNSGTYLALADMSGYATPIRVEYHTLGGVLAKTETPTIPADGLLAWVVSDGTSGRPTEGNIFVYS